MTAEEPSKLKGGPPAKKQAIEAETFVEQRSGRWAVDIVVMFEDGFVRKEINTYSSKRHAEIAASFIKRGADREHAPRRD